MASRTSAVTGAENPDRRSDFDESQQPPGETMDFIHGVLGATRNYYDCWGDWPTALQIAEQLGLIAKRGEL